LERLRKTSMSVGGSLVYIQLRYLKYKPTAVLLSQPAWFRFLCKVISLDNNSQVIMFNYGLENKKSVTLSSSRVVFLHN
jgi:uncharacterized protein (UPF0548 family)